MSSGISAGNDATSPCGSGPATRFRFLGWLPTSPAVWAAVAGATGCSEGGWEAISFGHSGGNLMSKLVGVVHVAGACAVRRRFLGVAAGASGGTSSGGWDGGGNGGSGSAGDAVVLASVQAWQVQWGMCFAWYCQFVAGRGVPHPPSHGGKAQATHHPCVLGCGSTGFLQTSHCGAGLVHPRQNACGAGPARWPTGFR